MFQLIIANFSDATPIEIPHTRQPIADKAEDAATAKVVSLFDREKKCSSCRNWFRVTRFSQKYCGQCGTTVDQYKQHKEHKQLKAAA